ncbi:MAG TPA: hypothetical protein VNX29_01970 [Kaistia sp.]|nr:hypothetical protein [Kaistia sp.]
MQWSASKPSDRDDQIAVSEPVPIKDIFVSGISAVEDHGSWIRIEMMVQRDTPYGPAGVVVARLAMTPDAVVGTIETLIGAVGSCTTCSAIKLRLS